MSKTIITHAAPDFDAACYVWLMKSFAPGFQDAQITFMPLNNLDRPALAAADSVGDMGGQYDPANWRFDHHQFRGNAATCAADMAWRQLVVLGHDLKYLAPLIDLIYLGDLAQAPAVGIHSQLRGWKIAANEIGIRLSDYEIYCHGKGILDAVAADLKKKAADKLELDQVVIWKSDDGLVWAIKDGGTGTSFAAYDEGARIVVYQGKPITLADNTITYPVGASRAPEWQDPHLGKLVDLLLFSNDPDLKEELSRWYLHNDGFFTGRGGEIAPDPKPLKISIKDLAWAFHLVWDR